MTYDDYKLATPNWYDDECDPDYDAIADLNGCAIEDVTEAMIENFADDLKHSHVED